MIKTRINEEILYMRAEKDKIPMIKYKKDH